VKSLYSRKEILITGGTGTLGKEITKQILSKYPDVRGIRIYSRDEEKHRLFQEELKQLKLSEGVSFLVGDIRDKTRLDRAMNGVDLVFHTAAMKQIPHCEYNPIEAVRTNVEGSVNVIDCAIDNCIEKVMLISTDKACYPVNLYGATKATAEKLFIHANVYSGNFTKLSVCRYGNVLGSRGSIIPVFKEQYEKNKTINITDERMTRFWIFIDEVAKFIIDRMMELMGGEIFIPEMLSLPIKEFAQLLYPETPFTIVGGRPGEKLHECLITEEESIYSYQTSLGFHIIDTHKQIRRAIPFKMTSEKTEKWIPDVLLGQIKKRGLI
jgi:UDP-N-acetylglucosamine 4,6-dehydratase